SSPLPFGLFGLRRRSLARHRRFAGSHASARRHGAALFESYHPIFPRSRHRVRLLMEPAGHVHFAWCKRADPAHELGVRLILGISAPVDAAKNELAEMAADDGCAVPAHQHHVVVAERAGERGALLRRAHQEIGVAELVLAVPERNARTYHSTEMVDRNERLAGDAVGQHCGRVMMADGDHVRTCLVDLAVNHALGIHRHLWRRDWFGIEGELVEIVGLDQLGRPRARKQIASGIGWMAHAEMAERVDHALVGAHAVCNRKLVADVGKGHGTFPRLWLSKWTGQKSGTEPGVQGWRDRAPHGDRWPRIN